ncbi:ABC transporter permease [Bacillus sp. FJAT-28004]|uniref:ABC transporter permease n=1 Tax=Bacillus sp. FJAT-28004 TaxID=1679165 RepID=UPI0006B42644|nr:ABC transporter permease subunit [Bacillus sp. FJAT-28004]
MKNTRFIINYHLMLIPGIILLIMFSIVPMFGIVIAFQNFIPTKGVWHSPWVGFDNFKYMFLLPDSMQILKNTIVIAISKILLGLIVPFIFSLLLNEVRHILFKRSIQTIVYLPHFLSWVILSGIFLNFFTLNGFINGLLQWFGIDPIMFLTSNFWFRPILVVSDVWKEFGFSTIVYLAAITSISTTLYEAAAIDGANRFKQLMHITIPSMTPIVILLTTLSLGNVLNAGFEQILNMYNPMVYSSSDIIDTYVYRIGLQEMQYGLATAVGLLKSVISFVLIVFSYKLAYKYANYRIF